MAKMPHSSPRRTFLAAVSSGALGISTVNSGTVVAAQSTETEEQDDDLTTFRIRIENASDSDTLQPSNGSSQSVPISPGVVVVYSNPNTVEEPPLFTPDEPAPDNGLEQLAETGTPTTLANNVRNLPHVSASGVFDTPRGNDERGPADVGDAYEFTINAVPGQYFTFASMFLPSNDLFFSPELDSIPLFYHLDDDPKPVSRDATENVILWDAGTEENEEPGIGPNQAPQQSNPDDGQVPEEEGPIVPVDNVDDGYVYPPVSDVIRVMIWPNSL